MEKVVIVGKRAMRQPASSIMSVPRCSASTAERCL
jgi:hypothetical protein